MMLGGIFSENPVLVKHCRARLRPQHILPFAAIAVAVAILITYGGIVNADVESALMMLAALQGGILLLMGTIQVVTSVTQARESGMLDFHRISPLRAATVALGFLLGGPIREYLLFAVTLPFTLVMVLWGVEEPGAWGLLLLDIVVVALLYHTAAVLAGLALPDRRGSGMSIVGMVVVLQFASMVPPAGYLTVFPTGTMVTSGYPGEELFGYRFFGANLSPFIISLLHQLPILFFLFIAAVRKMRHELTPPYAKPTAVLLYAVIGALMVGDSVTLERAALASSSFPDFQPIAATYVMLVVGLLLAAGVTPGAGDFARGIRHARKLGLPQVPLWGDFSANWPALGAFAVVFVLTGMAIAAATVESAAVAATNILVGVGIGAATVLYFGLAKQSFDLIFRRNSSSYLLLLLFMLWALPLVLGIVLEASASGSTAASVIMALSPLAGIGMAYSELDRLLPMSGGEITLVTSVLLVLGFTAVSALAIKRAELELAPEE